MRASTLAGKGLVLAVAAAAAAVLPLGCRLGVEEQVVWFPAAAAGPPDGPGPIYLEPRRNDLVAGVRRAILVRGEGAGLDAPEPPVSGDEPAADGRIVGSSRPAPAAPSPEIFEDAFFFGRAFADALRESKIFREVVFPLRDEKVDVIFEPSVRTEVDRNRLLNALLALTFLCYLDGAGFDYDHYVRLELDIRDPRRAERVVAHHETQSAMTAVRYPSAVWLVGPPVANVILAITETATTDRFVLERLAQRDFDRAAVAMVAWVGRESYGQPVEGGLREERRGAFSAEPKRCPVDPDIPDNTGKFCIVCGRNLWYPLLDRRADAGPGDGR